MAELVINGVPAALPAQTQAAGGRWGLRLDTLHTLAELCAWVQCNLGLGFDPALIDVLATLESMHQQGQPLTLTELTLAAGVAEPEVERVLACLSGAGALHITGHGERRQVSVTPRLAQVLGELRQRLDDALITRADQRDNYRLNHVSNTHLHALVDETFDRFFALDWLHLHHWGGSCYLMSSLVQQALLARGLRCRIEHGYIEALRGTSRGLLGAPGMAKPGQIDGHAFCIVDDRCLVDFGLGNARRLINREFFWAVSVDVLAGGALWAEVHHARIGQVLWHPASPTQAAVQQLVHCERLAGELLRRAGILPIAD